MRRGSRLLLAGLNSPGVLRAPAVLSAITVLSATAVLGASNAASAQVVNETETEPDAVHEVVELSWEAPPECPSREMVLGLVQLPEQPRGRLTARATVDGAGGQYHLTLETEQGGQTGHRQLTASSCDELGEVTAALLSLSLSAAAPAPRVEAPAPSPPPVAVAPAPRSPLKGWADLGVRAADGPLPRVSAGPLVRLALETRNLRLDAGGYGLVTVEQSGPETGVTRYFLFTAVVSGCALQGQTVRWGGCLGAELGVLEGHAVGAFESRRSAQPWVSPTAALSLGVEGGPWAIHVRPLLGVPLVRPRFQVEPFGTVFQPSSVFVAGELFVSKRF